MIKKIYFYIGFVIIVLLCTTVLGQSAIIVKPNAISTVIVNDSYTANSDWLSPELYKTLDSVWHSPVGIFYNIGITQEFADGRSIRIDQGHSLWYYDGKYYWPKGTINSGLVKFFVNNPTLSGDVILYDIEKGASDSVPVIKYAPLKLQIGGEYFTINMDKEVMAEHFIYIYYIEDNMYSNVVDIWVDNS